MKPTQIKNNKRLALMYVIGSLPAGSDLCDFEDGFINSTEDLDKFCRTYGIKNASGINYEDPEILTFLENELTLRCDDKNEYRFWFRLVNYSTFEVYSILNNLRDEAYTGVASDLQNIFINRNVSSLSESKVRMH